MEDCDHLGGSAIGDIGQKVLPMGWKGRGLWACISTRASFHLEGGKGTTSKAMKFQLRPDPLAR